MKHAFKTWPSWRFEGWFLFLFTAFWVHDQIYSFQLGSIFWEASQALKRVQGILIYIWQLVLVWGDPCSLIWNMCCQSLPGSILYHDTNAALDDTACDSIWHVHKQHMRHSLLVILCNKVTMLPTQAQMRPLVTLQKFVAAVSWLMDQCTKDWWDWWMCIKHTGHIRWDALSIRKLCSLYLLIFVNIGGAKCFM